MPTSDDGVKHFKNSEPVLLSEVIHDVLNINYESFKALIKLGAIYVNNNRQVKDKWILQESVFRVHTKPRRYNCDYSWKSLIVFENDSFVVLNKPSGVPSHPSVDNIIEDSMTQASLALGVPLFVTHRLDRLTSGLIVYAKRRSFVSSFNVQLIERKIQKKYVALVESKSAFPQEIVHYMNPAKGTPKKLSLEFIEGWDVCKLEILEQKRISPEKTWVKINLLTGRTHQIRAQMSFLQAPVLGDVLYGSKLPFQQNAIALKSCEIAFEYDGKQVTFSLDEGFDNPN